MIFVWQLIYLLNFPATLDDLTFASLTLRFFISTPLYAYNKVLQ